MSGYSQTDRPNKAIGDYLKDSRLIVFGQLGYKRSLLKDKFYLGLAFTPVLHHIDELYFYPWAAL